MGNFLIDKQFNDCKNSLKKMRENVLKAIMLNNVCLKKIQELEVIPITEQEYTLSPIYNEAMNMLFQTSQKLEQSYDRVKSKDKYWIITNQDRYKNLVGFVLNHSKLFCEMTIDLQKDNFVFDLEFDDIEQHHYLINNIAKQVIDELTIAIDKIDTSLKNEKGYSR